MNTDAKVAMVHTTYDQQQGTVVIVISLVLKW